MKWRVLVVLAAVVTLQSAGCRHCRCCGHRDSRIPPQDTRKDALPPPDPRFNEGPPPVIPTNGAPRPAPNPQPTGAYGGS